MLTVNTFAPTNPLFVLAEFFDDHGAIAMFG